MKLSSALICAILTAANATMLRGQDAPVLNETIQPLVLEPMLYPLAARLNQIKGAVVVRLKLDSDGKVLSATAISGARSLIPDCLANAKKWIFRPSQGNAVVLIYQFKIAGLCTLPCASQFAFYPPNVATITIGEAVVDHGGQD